MKSILYQLSKYCTTKPPPPIIEVDTKPETYRQDSLEDLLERICPGLDPTTKKYHITLLADMPNYQLAGTLYPREVITIYHLYYQHQVQITGEEETDTFLKQFIHIQDPIEYRQQYESSADETVKKIAITRVMIATYANAGHTVYVNNQPYNSSGHYQKDLDRLPVIPFRAASAAYLNIPQTERDAVRTQELLHAAATTEQVLLGRMGYLMIWHHYAANKDNANDNTVPLLPHAKLRITHRP